MKKRNTSVMYHFAQTPKLTHGDKRIIRTGDTHTIPNEKFGGRVCLFGLHASPTPHKAWFYVAGSILSMVKLHGKVVHDDWSPRRKSVATKRTYLKSVRLDPSQKEQLSITYKNNNNDKFNRLAKKFLRENPAI